jgi:RNA polymerase sigma-70 factor (ECF subfamily)
VYETSDSSVMRQVRDGDLGSMAVLFERHHRALLNYFVHMNGNRDFSEDLVQDVFVRMMKYRQSYQPDKPFSAWMYQIARNAQSDAMQKRRFEVELGHADVSMTHGMDEKLKREQEIELLRQAMARLSVDKRELLVLSRFQNLKYEEIASILGCEVGAVKVRVYRAVRALGQIFFELSQRRMAAPGEEMA